MNALTQRANGKPAASSNSCQPLFVQRKCGCGAPSKLTGQCADCEGKELTGVQPKLQVGPVNDVYEQEADRIADAVMRAPANQSAHSEFSQPPKVQRMTSGVSNPQANSNTDLVSDVTKSGGEPMDQATSSFMEERFGQDFSHVRIHTNHAAAQSARSINARAYTAGQHVVMAENQYAPNSFEGKKLLAHELTHTIQQRGTVANTVQRVGFFEGVARFFGGGTFELDELNEYLNLLTTQNKIEDNYDSDNKARAVVLAWKGDKTLFNLTVDIKRLLILEMLSGFTGDDDEQAIIDLLRDATTQEIRNIVDPDKGLYFTDIADDIHGSEYQDFLTTLEAKLKGEADIKSVREADDGSVACTFEKTLEIIDAENTAERILNPAIQKLATHVNGVAAGGAGVKETAEAVDCYFQGAQLAQMRVILARLRSTQANLRNHDYMCLNHGSNNPWATSACSSSSENSVTVAAVPRNLTRPTALCPKFFSNDRIEKAQTIIHESAHRARAIPPANTAEIYPTRCHEISLNRALVNAESYALLAKKLGA